MNKATYGLEHQELIKQCHYLIAAIANRPGGTKLLQGILPTLQMYAQYKANRKRRGSVR